MTVRSVAWDEGEFGRQSGLARTRSEDSRRSFSALRYYDPARDYQPGLQHADGDNREVRSYQFPGALQATDAQELVSRARSRGTAQSDNLHWRTGELDPALGPGSLVTIPNMAGLWKVVSWEWRTNGVELELARHRHTASTGTIADPGTGWVPPDRTVGPTTFHVFETPWDGRGSPSQRQVYAAATSSGDLWPGAAFFALRNGALVEMGQTLNQRAVIGVLVEPLSPSNALRFEPGAQLLVDLIEAEAELKSTDMAGLALGENRMLVGDEIIQFATATPHGNGRWLLEGVLRGRGATEAEAEQGHQPGASAILLDHGLSPLTDDTLAAGGETYAALGLGDDTAVVAGLQNSGATLRPPCPVHPSISVSADGTLVLGWVRRARGQWDWPGEVELPLVEQAEHYQVGFGPHGQPIALWTTPVPCLEIEAGEAVSLMLANPDLEFWVRQKGSFALSRPLSLGRPA